MKDFKRLKRSRLVIIFLVLALVISLVTAGYFYYKSKNLSPDVIEARNREETKKVLERLNSILLINSDSEPTVAVVEDIEKLKQTNEEFYKDVSIGDYLVFYTDRAIIYRFKENKVINIVPIVSVNSSSQNEREEME